MKKGCLVRDCARRRLPKKQLCLVHYQTHEVVMVKCTGEAHSNPYIDHCMICMPNWGSYPVAQEKPK